MTVLSQAAPGVVDTPFSLTVAFLFLAVAVVSGVRYAVARTVSPVPVAPPVVGLGAMVLVALALSGDLPLVALPLVVVAAISFHHHHAEQKRRDRRWGERTSP